jgi:hypothetical protein
MGAWWVRPISGRLLPTGYRGGGSIAPSILLRKSPIPSEVRFNFWASPCWLGLTEYCKVSRHIELVPTNVHMQNQEAGEVVPVKGHKECVDACVDF